MTFKKLLVALDGSKFSETAAQYGFWMAEKLKASVTGQHVLDPRLMDALLAPEFGSELEMSKTIESAEEVYSSIRKIGETILDLFAREASQRGVQYDVCLDEGHILTQIVQRSKDFDLVLTGHHGRGRSRIPTDLITGSIAERVAYLAHKPVLICMENVDKIERILVAFDGSEPSRGALLLGNSLSKQLQKELLAVVVIPSKDKKADAEITIEQAKPLLKDDWKENMFLVREGLPAETLRTYTAAGGSVLIVGAYGFRDPQDNVLGSTTASLVRQTNCSLLIYR